jgi:hypothetical protein
MTNREYALLKLQETIEALIDITEIMMKDGVPQNEEWVKAAQPLDEIMAIMGNYAKYKDEEVGKTKWLIKEERK